MFIIYYMSMLTERRTETVGRFMDDENDDDDDGDDDNVLAGYGWRTHLCR